MLWESSSSFTEIKYSVSVRIGFLEFDDQGIYRASLIKWQWINQEARYISFHYLKSLMFRSRRFNSLCQCWNTKVDTLNTLNTKIDNSPYKRKKKIDENYLPETIWQFIYNHFPLHLQSLYLPAFTFS